ncbi:MAG: F0F1 ATP synthase subunit B [Flavobacteriales bacterium]|jgi:F-type H+-transporting ATPase subunit b|nr:F0F1 ATP synthase subunit B [Flavobacteriales bacterium]MCF8461888.1 F0F1 ATP synthase subunit B [Flavobacteriales bacterium]
MGLVTPGIGLIIWMTIAFLVVWVGLGKLAWPAILETIKEREENIKNALASADNARAEMAKLQSDNEAVLKQAREERDGMLKDAKEIRERLIAEAEGDAKAKAEKIVADARESIQTEKTAAMAEIKNHVAALSIEIAEKILKSELGDAAKQKQLVDTLLDDIKLN